MPFFLKKTEDKQAAFRRSFYVAKLLDDSFKIPFTKYKFGIDALVGLLPIAGDFASAILSGYILLEAWRMGCTRRNLLKMLSNIALDFIIGLIPILGDFRDIVWKANMRNIYLIENEVFADRS